ncbi:hypothetical protein ACFL2S_16360 [Thermodesulfobacteriota bacterium]
MPGGQPYSPIFLSWRLTKKLQLPNSAIEMGGSTTGNQADEASIFLTTAEVRGPCYPEGKA